MAVMHMRGGALLRGTYGQRSLVRRRGARGAAHPEEQEPACRRLVEAADRSQAIGQGDVSRRILRRELCRTSQRRPRRLESALAVQQQSEAPPSLTAGRVACDGSGERIWAVLGEWTGDRGVHTILLIDGAGTQLKQQPLAPWSMKGGTPVQFDPVSRQLLLTVLQPDRRETHPALMDADTLLWRKILPVDVGEAQWLSP